MTNSETPKVFRIPIQVRIWMVLTASASLVHEFVQAQIVTILWGGLIAKYTLTMGVFILSLGLGAFFYPSSAKATKALTFQQIATALLGVTSPWLILWSNTHFERNFATIIAAILIFAVGFISGFEFPLLNKVSLEKYSAEERLKFSSPSFFGLMQFDYYGMALASLLVPFFAFRNFNIFSTSFIVSTLNLAIAFSCFLKWKSSETMKTGHFRLAIGLLAAVGVLILLGFMNLAELTNVAQRWVVQ